MAGSTDAELDMLAADTPPSSSWLQSAAAAVPALEDERVGCYAFSYHRGGSQRPFWYEGSACSHSSPAHVGIAHCDRDHFSAVQRDDEAVVKDPVKGSGRTDSLFTRTGGAKSKAKNVTTSVVKVPAQNTDGINSFFNSTGGTTSKVKNVTKSVVKKTKTVVNGTETVINGPVKHTAGTSRNATSGKGDLGPTFSRRSRPKKLNFLYSAARLHKGSATAHLVWGVNFPAAKLRKAALLFALRLVVKFVVEAVRHEWLDSFLEPSPTPWWPSRPHVGANTHSPATEGIHSMAAYSAEERKAYRSAHDLEWRHSLPLERQRQTQAQHSAKAKERRDAWPQEERDNQNEIRRIKRRRKAITDREPLRHLVKWENFDQEVWVSDEQLLDTPD